jgi:hypothetical protein
VSSELSLTAIAATFSPPSATRSVFRPVPPGPPSPACTVSATRRSLGHPPVPAVAILPCAGDQLTRTIYYWPDCIFVQDAPKWAPNRPLRRQAHPKFTVNGRRATSSENYSSAGNPLDKRSSDSLTAGILEVIAHVPGSADQWHRALRPARVGTGGHDAGAGHLVSLMKFSKGVSVG